jgi:hypothetical protein
MPKVARWYSICTCIFSVVENCKTLWVKQKR